MRNIKLIIQYDGTDFSGYELQPGKRTVRGELEKALFKIYKSKIKLVSASRTDAGVHALGQVVNFKAKTVIPFQNISKALNAVLAADIRVVKAEEKAQGFNARFDVKSKEYKYLIYNGEVMPAHLRKIIWHVKKKLDLLEMRKAAEYLVGKHDFSSFCAAGGDDNDFVRTIGNIDIRKSKIGIWNDCKFDVVSFRFIGDGFLYKMIRNLVGTLVDVGIGRTSPDKVKAILTAQDRRLAGRTAPAQGLCLIKINY